MATSSSADTRRDAQDILQVLLNAPQLAQYYHFDERPQRVPLKVVNRTSLDLGATGLTAAGRAVTVSTTPDAQALEITGFTIGDGTSEVAFTYRIEGVVGTGTFIRANGTWSVNRLSLGER